MHSLNPFPQLLKPAFSVLCILLLAAIAAADSLTIATVIPAPYGFARTAFPKGSFADWLRSRPVKSTHAILAYDGVVLDARAYNTFAVLDLPLLFRSDLEQCADFCMRLWAEYHRETNRLDKLYLFDYQGRPQMYRASGKTFSAFLKRAFANTNSYSLKRGCIAISDSEVVPGDMLIQNETGGIGHASMVVDMCESPQGKTLYLIGFSFMPAQQFHIEKAGEDYGLGGWFTLEGFNRYLSEYLPYGTAVLRRFKPL